MTTGLDSGPGLRDPTGRVGSETPLLLILEASQISVVDFNDKIQCDTFQIMSVMYRRFIPMTFVVFFFSQVLKK